MTDQEQIPFDLEKFKAGMKAKWGKQLIKYTYTATNGFICFEFEAGDPSYSALKHLVNAATMVSRHQHLIDSYDPKDTWVAMKDDSCTTLSHPFEWFEHYEYRLHKHNDLIKAWTRGAKIEFMEKDGTWVDIESPYWYEDSQYRIKPELEFTYPIYKQSKRSNVVVEFTDLTTGKVLVVGNNFYEVGHVQRIWTPHTDAAQWQDWTPITKSKPTTHCLAYDAKLFDHEQTTAVRARVVEKEVAEANGWHIIQEWEV